VSSLNILIIIDETVFYHPKFLEELILRTKDNIVSIGIVTEVGKKNSIDKYLMRKFFKLNLRELLLLVWYKYKKIFLDGFFNQANTVQSVSIKHKINHFDIKKDINQKKYLDIIKSLKPDIIVSSNSLYFGKELLEMPSICCINRHSGLLPSYAGLLPMFQSVVHNEKEVGISVHTMTSEIDQGIVLSNRKFKRHVNQSLFDLYEKAFELSVHSILEGINKIKNHDISSIDTSLLQECYFSFPSDRDWVLFRKNGGKFL